MKIGDKFKHNETGEIRSLYSIIEHCEYYLLGRIEKDKHNLCILLSMFQLINEWSKL